MDEKLRKKILEDIEKTGFVTELKAIEELLGRNWRISNNQIYKDLDGKVGREIDIIALKDILSGQEEYSYILRFFLVIEVKKTNDKHWIVFTSSNEENDKHIGWNMMYGGSNHEESKVKLENGLYINFPIFSENLLFEEKFFPLKKRFGRAFHEAFKKPNEKSRIYQSLLSVCKATWAEYLKYGEKYFDEKKFDSEHTVNLDLYIPIVLLDGKLCEFYLENGGQKELEEVDFVPIHFLHFSENYKSRYDTEIEFFPLILKLSYLEQFLSEVDQWMEKISNQMLEELKNRKQKKYSR